MGYPVSTTHSIIGGIVGSSIVLGILLNGADSALALVQWGEIGSIALSWVVSPVLGGVVSYALFYYIKKYILLYNEQADQRLKAIKQEKKAQKKAHKKAFERLSELEQVSYAMAMARDAEARSDEDFSPDDLETDYYQELHRIEQ